MEYDVLAVVFIFRLQISRELTILSTIKIFLP